MEPYSSLFIQRAVGWLIGLLRDPLEQTACPSPTLPPSIMQMWNTDTSSKSTPACHVSSGCQSSGKKLLITLDTTMQKNPKNIEIEHRLEYEGVTGLISERALLASFDTPWPCPAPWLYAVADPGSSWMERRLHVILSPSLW